MNAMRACFTYTSTILHQVVYLPVPFVNSSKVSHSTPHSNQNPHLHSTLYRVLYVHSAGDGVHDHQAGGKGNMEPARYYICRCARARSE